MVRNILAVVAGFATWTVLFIFVISPILQNVMSDAHAVDGAVHDTTTLLLYLLGSVVASLSAGFVAAKVAESDVTKFVYITGGALLAVGLVAQITSWDLTETWYNIAFLALLVPVTVIGGRLVTETKGNPMQD